MPQYSDVKQTYNILERNNQLSKTENGRVLLRNIDQAYLSRMIDFTEVIDSGSKINSFGKSFTDLVRPNKFIIRLGYENYGSDNSNTFFVLNDFVKTITAPTINTNKIVFKRGGKTIKLPLNQDVADNLELSFYQDIDGKSINDIMYLLNNQNEAGYHNRFNDDTKRISLTMFYMIKIAVPSDKVDVKSITDTALQFFDINLGYKNTGFNEPRDTTNKITFRDKIIEIRFNNIFNDGISGFEGDYERIDTYSELKVSLGFNGVEMKIWDYQNDEKETYEYNDFDGLGFQKATRFSNDKEDDKISF